MSREKYNLRIVLDIDEETRFGDIRRFVETLKGMPDDMPIFFANEMSNEGPELIGYLDQAQEGLSNGL